MKIGVPKKQGRLQKFFQEKSNSILNFSEIYSTIQMLLFKYFMENSESERTSDI